MRRESIPAERAMPYVAATVLCWPVANYWIGLKFRMLHYLWSGIIGLLIMPFGILWWSLHYSKAWYLLVLVLAVMAAVLWRVLRRRDDDRRERAEQAAKAAFIGRSDAYLDALPLADEAQCMRGWEDVNRAARAGRSRKSFKVHVGTRDYIASKLERELEWVWDHRGDHRSDERRKCWSLSSMVERRESSFMCEWGVNRIGLEMRRFAGERFAHVEVIEYSDN